MIKINSNNPGKTVTIMAGVHGNETAGLKAVKTIIPDLKIDNGLVNFVFGNPRAIVAGVRQIEMNLNRAFCPDSELTVEQKQSYERVRALELMKILDQSDALLDLHSSATLGSPAFAICEEHSFDLASQLPVEIISNGWDKLEPGGTDYYLNCQNKVAVCLECGHHEDQKAQAVAMRSISIFLAHHGIITKSTVELDLRSKKFVTMTSLYKTKTNFKPITNFSDFQNLEKGQVIGHDGDKSVLCEKDNQLIVFCRERKLPNEEAFLLGTLVID